MSRLKDLRAKRSAKNKSPKKPGNKRSNKSIVGLTLLLTGLGLIAVADVSSPQALKVFGDPYYFAKQQLLWAAVGLVALITGSLIDYRLLSKYAVIIFGVSLFFLLIVLIPGIGVNVLGARRWISIGPIGFQPSEAAKLATLILIARFVEEKYSIKYVVATLGIICALIMLQPDLGTTVMVLFIGGVQMFAAGYSLVTLGAIAGGGSVLTTILILFSDYRKQRLVTFIKNLISPLGFSESEASGSAYHIRQILIAIGSGGLFGVGVGQSRQKHLFLPETATDSVFAVLAEEFGFLGAVTLLLLLMYFTLMVVRIAINAPDKFSSLLAIGIAAWIGGQTVLNLSAMLALAPLTGIPLPFFSYGGSSLTMTLLSIGILINIQKQSK